MKKEKKKKHLLQPVVLFWCKYVRRQAEDVKGVCVRWNKYNCTSRMILRNMSQRRNITFKKAWWRKEEKNGVRFRSGREKVSYMRECTYILWRRWKLHFILHFVSYSKSYVPIYKCRRTFLNTRSRERAHSTKYTLCTLVQFPAVFSRGFVYEEVGTCSMILCNIALRARETKRKKS